MAPVYFQLHRLPHRPQRGYVLLLTLLMIPVVAMALLATARESMTRALEANRQALALQHRWAALSCSQVFMPKSGLMLDLANQEAEQPLAMAPVCLTLGDFTIMVVAGDEQAKVNLNAVFRKNGAAAVQAMVLQLAPGINNQQTLALNPQVIPVLTAPAPQPSVAPATVPAAPTLSDGPKAALLAAGGVTPIASATGTSNPLPPNLPVISSESPPGTLPGILPGILPGAGGQGELASWEQVFSPLDVGALLGQKRQSSSEGSRSPGIQAESNFNLSALQRSPLMTLTLWGDGRINFRRAAPPVLEQVIGSVAGMNYVSQLLDQRQKTPGLSVASIKPTSSDAATQNKIDAAAKLLADTSGCYSFWLVLKREDRVWYELWVQSGSSWTPAQKIHFSW